MEDSFAFSLHDRAGTVAVAFAANSDPEGWGYGILGLPWPSSLATGLPVLKARVSFEGDGYLAVMGWIQVVRIEVSGSSRSLVPGVEKAPAGEHAWVDGPPQLSGLGVPFVSFGVCPTLFDSPASTESDVRFLADSFLTASPDGPISRRSRPCFGMRWGYSTQAGQSPELIPPKPLDANHWHGALSLLQETFADWHFDPDWVN